jgi:hypothetical protein
VPAQAEIIGSLWLVPTFMLNIQVSQSWLLPTLPALAQGLASFWHVFLHVLVLMVDYRTWLQFFSFLYLGPCNMSEAPSITMGVPPPHPDPGWPCDCFGIRLWWRPYFASSKLKLQESLHVFSLSLSLSLCLSLCLSLFLSVLGFEFMASCLLSRCSIT